MDAVETMTYFGQVPWHGKGDPILPEERYSAKAGLQRGGIDWDVELRPIYYQPNINLVEDFDGVQFNYEGIEQAKVVVRKTDQRVLGVVGPRYTPLQNHDAFEWFQPMFDARLCAINAAGSLHNGEKVWILAEIMGLAHEIVPGDEVARFLMISNSHNGTTSVRVGFTPIRVVCANTLAMAHSSAASKLIRLRHHKDIKLNLEKIRDIIDLANQEFEATAEQYRFLAASRVAHADDLRKYVKLAAGVDPSIKDEDIPTRTQNIMIELLEKISSGIGTGIAGVKGTWWAAYNGVNEYLNYNKGRTADARLDNLWFGTEANNNLKLLNGAIKGAEGKIDDAFKNKVDSE